METTINYWAIVAGAGLSMAIGSVWYGPLFGKKWMEIVGVGMTRVQMATGLFTTTPIMKKNSTISH